MAHEQSKLFLPPHLAKKQMIPTAVVLEVMERIAKEQRKQALRLFRKILDTTETTKEQLIAQIDALLTENENDV